MKKLKNVIDLAPFLERTDFPGSSVVKNSPANAGDSGDVGSFPGSGRSPGGGKGNPLQYACLGNPMDREAWWDILQYAYLENLMDRGAWWAIDNGVAKT